MKPKLLAEEKARSREIFENRFQKLMGLDQKLPNLRRNILKKFKILFQN